MDETADISEQMSDVEDDIENGQRDESMTESGTTGGQGEVKKKYDPKDPSRPRRKKARRACFACQRAHLTCGMSSHYAMRLQLHLSTMSLHSANSNHYNR